MWYLQVTCLRPVKDAAGCYSHCVAQLSDGTTVEARRVLVAIGSTNMQRLPEFAQLLQEPVQQAGAAAADTSSSGSSAAGSPRCSDAGTDSSIASSSSSSGDAWEPASCSSSAEDSPVSTPRVSERSSCGTRQPVSSMACEGPGPASPTAAGTGSSCSPQQQQQSTMPTGGARAPAAHDGVCQHSDSSGSAQPLPDSSSAARQVLPQSKPLHAWEVAAHFACLRQQWSSGSSSSSMGGRARKVSCYAGVRSTLLQVQALLLPCGTCITCVAPQSQYDPSAHLSCCYFTCARLVMRIQGICYFVECV